MVRQHLTRTALLTFICAASWVSPASALVLKATYTGTVTSDSFDLTNMFGLGNSASLGGQSVVMSFLYDTALPGTGYSSDGATFAQSYGGPGYGPFNSPFLSATITINGTSAVIASSYAASVYQAHNSDGSAVASHGVQDSTFTGFNDHSNYAVTQIIDTSGQIPLDLQQPYVVDASNIRTNLGYFQFVEFGSLRGSYAVNTYGNVIFDSLKVAPLSTVPLPGSFPLLAAGLAGVIAAMRQRSRTRKTETLGA